MNTVSIQLRRRLVAVLAAFAALSASAVVAEHGSSWTHLGKSTPTSGKKCPGGRFNPDGSCAGPIRN